MQGTMAMDQAAVSPMTHENHVRRQQMPLPLLNRGEAARVLKVRGTDEMHHHLENLGFVAGAPLKVVNKQGSNVIVEIRGAQVALDKSAASKIITC